MPEGVARMLGWARQAVGLGSPRSRVSAYYPSYVLARGGLIEVEVRSRLVVGKVECLRLVEGESVFIWDRGSTTASTDPGQPLPQR